MADDLLPKKYRLKLRKSGKKTEAQSGDLNLERGTALEPPTACLEAIMSGVTSKKSHAFSTLRQVAGGLVPLTNKILALVNLPRGCLLTNFAALSGGQILRG